MQFSKCSGMVIADMKDSICCFSGIVFYGWKRSYMCSADLLGDRFPDVQELRFKTEKISDIEVLVCKGIFLQIVMNGVLWLRSGQIWAAPSCNRVHLLMLMNRVIRLRIDQIWIMPF